ncbi:Aminotransferase class-V [Fragilaria crotonensis]|nr:Aminotransferase class-V [Fragilaria crotonensis]
MLLRSKDLPVPFFPAVATATGLVAGAIWLLKRRRQKKLSISLRDLKSLVRQLVLLCTEEPTDCIYLDYNGTTPVHPGVLSSMLPYLTVHFGNPSSSHHFGAKPKLAIEIARQSLLNLIGRPNEPLSSIWFTGCGTESDNLAIHLALQTSLSSSSSPQKPHIVTTNVEHPAVTECLKALEEDGTISVTYVPVQPDGRVTVNDVISSITDHTILVTVMLANNESGALQPVAEIAAHCREKHPNILFHTDAAQACGKVDVASLCRNADLITLVGHKIGVPKGVAALYVSDTCRAGKSCLSSSRGVMLQGGGQEGGQRGGTENVPYIVGMGKAAELALDNLPATMQHMEAMRSRLLEKLIKAIGDDIRPNGPIDPQHRLPNTLSIGIPGIVSGSLLNKIGHQVAASAGAACHSSGTGQISSVLKAMKVPTEYAQGTLRLSIGPSTNPDEIDRAATIIADQVKLERQEKL